MGIARYLTPAPEAAALRLRGWITVVAGITVLALNAVKPVPLGPRSWLLPSVAIAAALLAMCMAAPLARAIAERRARRGKVVAR
jgi:hypothetical protein